MKPISEEFIWYLPCIYRIYQIYHHCSALPTPVCQENSLHRSGTWLSNITNVATHCTELQANYRWRGCQKNSLERSSTLHQIASILAWLDNDKCWDQELYLRSQINSDVMFMLCSAFYFVLLCLNFVFGGTHWASFLFDVGNEMEICFRLLESCFKLCSWFVFSLCCVLYSTVFCRLRFVFCVWGDRLSVFVVWCGESNGDTSSEDRASIRDWV